MTLRLGRIIVAILIGLTGFTLATAAPSTAQRAGQGVHGADVNCSDFATQAAAQHYFLNHGGPQNDPDGLDADGDGVACESNPCPCDNSTGGGGGGGGGGNPPPQPIKQFARVIHVIDGDTVRVRLSRGGRPLVELIGLDAPTVKPKQCGGLGARDALKKQLPRGTRVTLSSDLKVPVKTPKGHLNRYVESRRHEAGRFQVLQGWARLDKINFTRSRVYNAALRSAQRHNEGIWGGCGGLR